MPRFYSSPLIHPLTLIQERLLPENFEVPAWEPPSELALAKAPAFTKSTGKRPVSLASIAVAPDDSDENEDEEIAEEAPRARGAKTQSASYVLFILFLYYSLTLALQNVFASER